MDGRAFIAALRAAALMVAASASAHAHFTLPAMEALPLQLKPGDLRHLLDDLHELHADIVGIGLHASCPLSAMPLSTPAHLCCLSYASSPAVDWIATMNTLADQLTAAKSSTSVAANAPPPLVAHYLPPSLAFSRSPSVSVCAIAQQCEGALYACMRAHCCSPAVRRSGRAEI